MATGKSIFRAQAEFHRMTLNLDFYTIFNHKVNKHIFLGHEIRICKCIKSGLYYDIRNVFVIILNSIMSDKFRLAIKSTNMLTNTIHMLTCNAFYE